MDDVANLSISRRLEEDEILLSATHYLVSIKNSLIYFPTGDASHAGEKLQSGLMTRQKTIPILRVKMIKRGRERERDRRRVRSREIRKIKSK